MSNYPSGLHLEKRKIQNKIFNLITQKTIYCLGGPDINKYAELFPSCVEKIISYESDSEIYKKQVKNLTNPKVELRFGNILEAPIDPEAFYDLDLMGTIDTCDDIIKKFKDCEFVITLLNGRCKEQIKKIFKSLKEKLVRSYKHSYNINTSNTRECRYVTNKNRYFFTTYYETSPMLMLYKIPKKYYSNN